MVRIRALLVDRLGADRVVEVEPQTVGEDFSRYGRAFDPPVPSAMLCLGAAPPGAGKGDAPRPGLHSARFFPDYERAIPLGVGVISGLIRALTAAAEK